MNSRASSLHALDRSRVQMTQVHGIPIMTLDFSHANGIETLEMLEEYRRIVLAQKPDSARLLVDVQGIAYDASVSAKWKAVRMELDPYIHASAIYGVQGLVGVAIRSYTELMLWLKLPRASQKIRVFKSREDALTWLLAS